ncbi:MAG: type IV secretion system DNA-binding domain-containing protein [Candidatus Portnoybacteria bacterium]|nr:type IV secretion system DNA-binding domain-containing protein [Candidatus Portnoybacteria bacterium]
MFKQYIPYLIASGVFLAIISVVIALIIDRIRKKGKIIRSLNMDLFLVKLPRETKEDISSEEKKSRIAVMEQFLSGLGALKEGGFLKRFLYNRPYIVLEIAVPFSTAEISFYISTPKKYSKFIQKQIYGFYPKATVEDIEDYNIFHPKGCAAGGRVKLEKKNILPIRTYKELEIDPLESLSNTLSKIEETGEGGVIQIAIKPAQKGWNKFGLKVAQKMNEGLSFEDAVKGKEMKKEDKEKPQATKVSPLGEETIKALQAKASKPGFETNIRILFSAETEERAEGLLAQSEGVFEQFSAPNINSLKFEKQTNKNLKNLCYNFSFRMFSEKDKMILNSEELSSIFHFPLTAMGSPKLKWLKAKEAPPPSDVPKEGVILGKNIFRGDETVIRMAEKDRRRHLYIIGQTGTGKSVFISNMIRQDIEAGKGLAFIDPHGDVVESVLSFVPKERMEDVIYFDPSDIERPMGLNLLEYDPNHPEQKTFLANETINIFKKLWEGVPEAFGPMFEQYMRNALLLVMDDPESGSTLLEVPKVLADTEFRKHKLLKTNNQVVKDFWEKEAEKAGGEAALANMVPYITSKTNLFLANDIMRPIICQQKSAFDFRKVMDEKKILLINLSKGRLGELNSNLLGLTMVGKILMAAFSRVDMPEEKRNDFYLYIDEFQNFTTDSISTILAEARKYKLNLIIAHQFIAQLKESIRDSVFGNAGSMASFRIGAEDAEALSKQFEPTFTQQDLMNIDNFNAYLKLLINNQTAAPFNIQTYPPIQGNAEIASKIKELSRSKYGRDRLEVEREVDRRSSKAKSEIKPPEESEFH